MTRPESEDQLNNGDTYWLDWVTTKWRDKLWTEVHRVGGPRKARLVELGRELDQVRPGLDPVAQPERALKVVPDDPT